MDRRLVLLSHRYRFAWVQVPKVASTTLKSILERAHGVDAPVDGVRPINNQRLAGSELEYRLLGPRGLAGLIEEKPDYYCFCFVRNPYARLVSGYRNKLSRYARRYRPLAYATSKAEGLTRTGAQTSFFSRLSRRVPFEQFVLGLRRHGFDFDDHFRRQTKITQADRLPYAKLGRIEQFDADLAEIAGAVGMPLPEPPADGALNSSAGRGKGHDPFTPETRDAAYDMYRNDFETFGYAA